MGQRLTCRHGGLVVGQVGHPERVHDAGDDQGTVDPGEPEDLAHQHRQQHGRQGVGGGHQRLDQGHDGFRQDHAGAVFQQQVEGMQGQDDHQHRDQHLEGAGDTGRHLGRQLDGDVVALEEGIDLGRIDGGDQGREDPLAGEVLHGDGAILDRRGHQHEGHQAEQTRGDRIQPVLAGQAGAYSHRDEQGHQPHAQLERQQQLRLVGRREVEPGAGEAPLGLG
ncbi:hypothetical protein D3C84_478640 [compost metagenome]